MCCLFLPFPFSREKGGCWPFIFGSEKKKRRGKLGGGPLSPLHFEKENREDLAGLVEGRRERGRKEAGVLAKNW